MLLQISVVFPPLNQTVSNQKGKNMKQITMIHTLLLTLIFGNVQESLSEETTKFPKIIIDALSSYEQNGADSLIPMLLKGSALADDKTALSQSNNIKQIETFYGKYLGYEPSRIVKLSNSTSIYYYVMNYELGPLFGMAIIYNSPNKKSPIVTTYNFHTKPENIYPPALLTVIPAQTVTI